MGRRIDVSGTCMGWRLVHRALAPQTQITSARTQAFQALAISLWNG
ncbi:MAG: hypothetical protein RMK32_08715 [Anaerolineae bacterium]|nr:hypothetical protein [Anaerolineae bacterium]